MSRWESQFVDNNKLTTISDLTPHTIYTIRVEAYTAIGPGPPSAPVQVGTCNWDFTNVGLFFVFRALVQVFYVGNTGCLTISGKSETPLFSDIH